MLVLLLLATVATFSCAQIPAQHAVDMRDVPTLIFNADDLVYRVRSAPQPAMQCQGEHCQQAASLLPRRAMCKNEGTDDQARIIWRCEFPNVAAEIDIPGYKVACEGWSGPGDPLTRSGSCVIRYELVRRRVIQPPPPPPPAIVVTTTTEETVRVVNEPVVTHVYPGPRYTASSDSAAASLAVLLILLALIVGGVLLIGALAACCNGPVATSSSSSHHYHHDHYSPAPVIHTTTPVFVPSPPAPIVHHHYDSPTVIPPSAVSRRTTTTTTTTRAMAASAPAPATRTVTSYGTSTANE